MSPLRRRMIEDMTVRKFVEKTQKDYIRYVKDLTAFLAFLGRSPDTATAEDLRRYRLHLTENGVRPTMRNHRVPRRWHRLYAGNLSPSGGAATSKALTMPASIPK